MFNCQKCPTYSTCKKICDKVAKILADDGIKSADWIRPRKGKGGKMGWREIPFSSLGQDWQDMNTEDKEWD